MNRQFGFGRRLFALFYFLFKIQGELRMAVPRIHIISSSKKNNHSIAAAAVELEPTAEIIEHIDNDDFLGYCAEAPEPVWSIVVTDLIKISMPGNMTGRYMPVIHFTDDYIPAENNGIRGGKRSPKSRSRILVQDIKQHLEETISAAQLFLRLKSGVGNLDNLDERERSVVLMAADGVPNKTIARRLNVSIKTIEHCRRKAYIKLGVKSSAEVASLVTFEKFFCLFDQHAFANDVPVVSG